MPDPLDELDRLLLDLPWEEDGLLLSGVDGLIAGAIVPLPPVANDEWLPMIWGGAAEAFPGDPQRSARLVDLAVARKAEVIGELLRGDFAYQPLLDVDERRGEIMWETWIDGFARALALCESAWQALLTHKDESLRAPALDLRRLIEVDRGGKMPRRERDALTEEAPGMIPVLVELLYRGVRGLKRAGVD
ncbi:MAG TPA: UPF0149 family protein [Allosphingosinicella sp.]|nr:UPF0149 family protein [Allosphingosinicella sp.]